MASGRPRLTYTTILHTWWQEQAQSRGRPGLYPGHNIMLFELLSGLSVMLGRRLALASPAALATPQTLPPQPARLQTLDVMPMPSWGPMQMGSGDKGPAQEALATRVRGPMPRLGIAPVARAWF